jgi:hypothetical protein
MNAEKIKELRGLVADGIGNGDVHLRMPITDTTALLDEVEALTADAERWRYIRHRMTFMEVEQAVGRCAYPEHSDIDAAIDAARHEPAKSPQDLKDAEHD